MAKYTSSSFSRQEIMLVTALAFFQFTHIMDFMVLMPLGPRLIENFAITNHEFSWLVSSYTLAAAIMALIASTFIDRFHRKKALIHVYSGFLLGTLLCGLADNFYLLLFSRMITGAFGGVMNALVFSIIGDSFDYSRRGSATGIIMAAFSVATVAGVPIGLWLANHMGWNAPFLFVFYAGLVALVFAHFTIPLTARVARNHPYRDLFREKNHLLAFALIFTMMLAGFSVIPYISNFLVFNAGFAVDKLPLIYLCGGAVTFFTSRLIGYLADRYGKKRTYFVTAGLSIFPIFYISQISSPDTFVILLTTTTFFVFISGRFVPGMAIITSAVKPYMRGSFMTINSSLQQFGSATATIIGGFIISEKNNVIYGYDRVAWFAIAASLLSLYLVYKIRILDGKEIN